MDMSFVIILILCVLGAALVVGGIVAYRGSPKTGVRAFASAAVAAGVVMWAIVIFSTSLSATHGDGPPMPTLHYEKRG